MKKASLCAAAGIVLVANGLALVHAARNRAGSPDAQITLTERELRYNRDPDNSGLELTLMWRDTNSNFFAWRQVSSEEYPGLWLDREKLQSLGFDCGIAPSDPKAESFYRRQRDRTGFVALEYNGPAWLQGSRLAATDAASDALALRSRHPDRNAVLVAPAVFHVAWAGQTPKSPARLYGTIQEIPSTIHVPRPYSDEFPGSNEKVRYQVHVRYGKLFEPWVDGVEFVGK